MEITWKEEGDNLVVKLTGTPAFTGIIQLKNYYYYDAVGTQERGLIEHQSLNAE